MADDNIKTTTPPLLVGDDDNFKMVRAAYRYFKKCGYNDLLEYFFCEEHRIIDKPIRYFAVYDHYLKKFRNTDAVILEIGVQNGGSTQMWKKYFGKDAKIIGVDIDKRCKSVEDEQISIEIGAQEDVNFWKYFKEKYPRIDVLLDDGGHTMAQQIITFQQMFPHLRDGGIYLCEDCGTSYWKSHGGGNHPNTFIEFTKRLIDEINAFDIVRETKESSITYNTMNIGSIHFYPAVVVIEKHFIDLPFDLMNIKYGRGGI